MRLKDIYYIYKYGNSLYKTKREYRNMYLSQDAMNGRSNVRFYNWWPVDDYSTLWFYQFIQNIGLLNDNNNNKRICFCSVFNKREVLSNIKNDIKIFFSGENLHLPVWSQYADALLGDKDCLLSLGFDYFEDARYFRFPLWLTYILKPTSNDEEIKLSLQKLRYPTIENRDRFACMIARADISGLRTDMYNALNNIDKIDCPSTLFHNDDSLKDKYLDNKKEYLRNYTFNICPENSNAMGYCTEKVFEAIEAGCIPIYWGCYNIPEPKILNHDAIIFWDKNDNGEKAVEQIIDLYNHPSRLKEFLSQPRLLPSAEEEIVNMINDLKIKLSALL